MRRYFHLFVLLALATLSRAQVRGWEGTLVLPTYEEGRPTDWWNYTAGALAAHWGSQQEADQRFQKALLLPDRMLSYHFTRMARAEAGP
jgi:hypothetical protein